MALRHVHVRAHRSDASLDEFTRPDLSWSRPGTRALLVASGHGVRSWSGCWFDGSVPGQSTCLLGGCLGRSVCTDHSPHCNDHYEFPRDGVCGCAVGGIPVLYRPGRGIGGVQAVDRAHGPDQSHVASVWSDCGTVGGHRCVEESEGATVGEGIVVGGSYVVCAVDVVRSDGAYIPARVLPSSADPGDVPVKREGSW